MGVHNSVAAFTIPLGATITMDGTAIMQEVATGFIAQAYGIDLAFGDYLMVILTATLASIGTAAVPSAGGAGGRGDARSALRLLTSSPACGSRCRRAPGGPRP